MSHNLSSPPSNAPPSPNQDFTGLASRLQETAQALLAYSEANKNTPPETGSKQNTPPLPSKREQRKELFREFYIGRPDMRAFAEKELATLFEQEYARGNFQNEIRYYYVASHNVRFEQHLLRQHHKKDILSLLVNTRAAMQATLFHYTKAPHENANPQDSLVLLGEEIAESLQLLTVIYKHLNSYKLLHKTMLPPSYKR